MTARRWCTAATETPATWTVVDFKTDKELDLALDVYRRQVGLYAAMIGRATGQATAPVLIRV